VRGKVSEGKKSRTGRGLGGAGLKKDKPKSRSLLGSQTQEGKETKKRSQRGRGNIKELEKGGGKKKYVRGKKKKKYLLILGNLVLAYRKKKVMQESWRGE